MPSIRHPSIRHAVLVALLVVVTTAMLLTSRQMSDLRHAVPLLSQTMSWLEGWDTPFDLDHVALFAAVGAALRVLLPRLRWYWLVLLIAMLAAGTELLQYVTIGRTPRLLDARDDLLGGSAGLLLGAMTLWCVGLVRRWLRWARASMAAPAAATPPTDARPLPHD